MAKLSTAVESNGINISLARSQCDMLISSANILNLVLVKEWYVCWDQPLVCITDTKLAIGILPKREDHGIEILLLLLLLILLDIRAVQIVVREYPLPMVVL